MCLTDLCLQKPEVRVLTELLRKSNTNAYFHSYRVARLAEDVLNTLPDKYSKEEQREIIIGALLHDIGKIFVPLNLTQMGAVLSKNERQIVETHASTSFEVVYPVFSEIVQNICLLHHERANGSGYPQKETLSGLPEYVLLVQVADIFDALTAPRVYKAPYSREKALEIMKKEALKLEMDDFYYAVLSKVVETAPLDYLEGEE